MKVLLLNQTFYPDTAATGLFLTDLSLKLVENDHEVTVLCGQRGYLKPDILFQREEKFAGINIKRLWSPPFPKRGRILRYISAIYMNTAFALKLARMRDFDRIVVMTTPPLLAWITTFLTKRRRTKVLLWAMDINPTQAIRSGWIREDSLLARFFYSMQRFSLRATQKIVALDHYMGDLLVSQGADAGSTRVIPLWLDRKHLKRIEHDQNHFRREHGLQDKFVVMYSGNHSLCHPLITVLETAKAFRDDDSVVFYFIGGGVRTEEVARYKETHGLSNIVQLPYQNRSSLKYSLSAADLHVVSMGEEFVGVVHPSKIYGIIALGKPILYVGPQASSVSDLLHKGDIGFHVEHGDIQGAKEAIEAVRGFSQEDHEMLISRSETLSAHFAREQVAQDLVDFLIS